MNLKQAKRIIANFESAVRADEMKGASNPDDIIAIEVELEMARYKLSALITVLLSHCQHVETLKHQVLQQEKLDSITRLTETKIKLS